MKKHFCYHCLKGKTDFAQNISDYHNEKKRAEWYDEKKWILMKEEESK